MKFKAILVDIDGTLAKMTGRGPFEWMRVGEDKVNEPVKKIVNLYAGAGRVIIFSGRDGVCRDLTVKWLQENGIRYIMEFAKHSLAGIRDTLETEKGKRPASINFGADSLKHCRLFAFKRETNNFVDAKD